jgi:haloalkane dehalogenase
MTAQTTPGAAPYGELRFMEIRGRRMAYVDGGRGDAIVFQHGNPTSSYLWRNVMPHLEGLGRLVACDLIGMGASDKLDGSGPDRYHYHEHRDHLFELWEALDLGDRVTLVLHDWGGALGFDWARRHPERVAGIAHMEAVVTPMEWDHFPDDVAPVLRGFRTAGQGEEMVLANNMFIEAILPGMTQRTLSDEEMNRYRAPFRNAGEDRRPTLSWPRDIPIAGEPADVVRVIEQYQTWLAASDVPKLLVRADPGIIIRGRVLDEVRRWPNQTEVTVPGLHFVQEDAPHAIGQAVASFVEALR